MTTESIRTKIESACNDLITAEASGVEITDDMRERVKNTGEQYYDTILPSSDEFVQRLLNSPEQWAEAVQKLEEDIKRSVDVV